MKKIRQLIEFFIVLILFSFLKLIPINLVSVLGGKIFKILGPFTKSHNVALSNYKRIFRDFLSLTKLFLTLKINKKAEIFFKKNKKPFGKESQMNLVQK